MAIDDSTDNGLQKMNPVTVRIFDPDFGRVSTKFLNMCLSSGTASATAQMILRS